MRKIMLIIALTVSGLQAQAAFYGYCNTLIVMNKTTPSWGAEHGLLSQRMQQNGYSLVRDADGRGSDGKFQLSGKAQNTVAAIELGLQACNLERSRMKNVLADLGGKVPASVTIHQCAYAFEDSVYKSIVCAGSETFQVP